MTHNAVPLRFASPVASSASSTRPFVPVASGIRFDRPLLAVEPLGQKRPARSDAPRHSDLLECLPGGRIGSQISFFLCVFAYVNNSSLASCSRRMYDQLARVQRPQRPGFVGQAVGVAIKRIVRNDFGEHRLGKQTAAGGLSALSCQRSASDSPGNGEPDSSSSTSTIVAASRAGSPPL